MGSIAVSQLNAMLNALAGRASYPASAGVFAKLHIGAPGAAGTSNPAAETTRQAVTFGSAASGGSISNTADVTWTNLAATETLTHVSFWDASSGGTFLGSDDLPASKNVNAGDTFVIPTGATTLSLT